MKSYEQLKKTNSNTVDYRSIKFDFEEKYYLAESTNGLFSVYVKDSDDKWFFIRNFLAPIESSKEFLINRTLDEINWEDVD